MLSNMEVDLVLQLQHQLGNTTVSYVQDVKQNRSFLVRSFLVNQVTLITTGQIVDFLYPSTCSFTVDALLPTPWHPSSC